MQALPRGKLLNRKKQSQCVLNAIVYHASPQIATWDPPLIPLSLLLWISLLFPLATFLAFWAGRIVGTCRKSVPEGKQNLKSTIARKSKIARKGGSGWVFNTRFRTPLSRTQTQTEPKCKHFRNTSEGREWGIGSVGVGSAFWGALIFSPEAPKPSF